LLWSAYLSSRLTLYYKVIHFHNGRIYTDEEIKDSMTINSGTGKIISIGDHPEASHKVDLQGKLVLPVWHNTIASEDLTFHLRGCRIHTYTFTALGRC